VCVKDVLESNIATVLQLYFRSKEFPGILSTPLGFLPSPETGDLKSTTFFLSAKSSSNTTNTYQHIVMCLLRSRDLISYLTVAAIFLCPSFQQNKGVVNVELGLSLSEKKAKLSTGAKTLKKPYDFGTGL
jgi:hypothetical protein